MPGSLDGPNGTATNRVSPEGLSSCIWVDAGLVSYKLCDREFDCESCRFDEAMRQGSPRETRVSTHSESETGNERSLKNSEDLAGLAREFFSRSAADVLPTGRLYSRNHVWARKVDEGRYRVGLDKRVVSLFHDTWSVILPQVSTVSRRNSPIAWIVLEDGTIAMRSPMNGRVSKTNSQLKDTPSLIKSDPYESGWVCEVTDVDGDTSQVACFDASGAKAFYDNQFFELEKILFADLERVRNSVGKTMADGGMRAKSLKDLLGSQRYISLLKKLLSSEV